MGKAVSGLRLVTIVPPTHSNDMSTKIIRKSLIPEKSVTVSTIYNGNYFFTGETTLFRKKLNLNFNSLIPNPITKHTVATKMMFIHLPFCVLSVLNISCQL